MEGIRVRRLLNILIVACFITHLTAVIVFEPTNVHRRYGVRQDCEGLSWILVYLLSLALYIAGWYNGLIPKVSRAYLWLSVALGLLLLIWDLCFYYKLYILSYSIYTLLICLFVICILHAVDHYPYLALIQLPVFLRTLLIYFGDCDHCHH